MFVLPKRSACVGSVLLLSSLFRIRISTVKIVVVGISKSYFGTQLIMVDLSLAAKCPLRFTTQSAYDFTIASDFFEIY